MARFAVSDDIDWVGYERRFFSHVDQDGPPAALRPDLGCCWLWTAKPDQDGYGQIWRARTTVHAHKAAWEIAARRLAPHGLRFRHFACDVTLCVNPAHIQPRVARDTPGTQLFAAAWNARHDVCTQGHPLTARSTFDTPGGLGCRTCRRAAEARRRR